MTTPRDGRKATEKAAERAPRSPSREPHARETDPGRCEQVEQTLDDALADSFPASDPVSIVTSQHEEAWEDTPGQTDRDREQTQARDAGQGRDPRQGRDPAQDSETTRDRGRGRGETPARH